MIRFVVLFIVVMLSLAAAMGSSIFGGVALLAVCVTGFGLAVALYADLMRES